MKKIRKWVFETNSSSTHAIVVDTKTEYTKGLFKTDNPIYVKWGEFWWEEDVYNDFHTKLDYMITMVNSYDNNFFERIQKLLFDKTWLKIEKNFTDQDYIYVDHQDPSLFTEMKDTEILQYLFNDKSRVVTGNDNVYEDSYDMKEANKLEGVEWYNVYYKGN